jgi:Tfp pilus assembly protein PilF
MSVFVRPASSAASKKFVGHVEQMHASRCFLASSGKMGCSTCHDPHQLPAAAERVAYYRDRCLSCHAEKDCTLPIRVRLKKSSQDSCIDCHMPAGQSDIPHASITDHRIPRHIEPLAPLEQESKPPTSDELPLVHFHRMLVEPGCTDIARDLGIALMDRFERYPERIRRALGLRALPLLEAGLQADLNDISAWEAKANALWALGRTEEAAAVFEVVLSKAPLHEAALHSAATLAMERERPGDARNYWARAIQVNPWRYEFHYGLAAARAQVGDWLAAAPECEEALRLNPFKGEVRKLLVRCLLATGAKDRARSEFERLLALEPADAETLRRWYAEHQE